MKTILYFLFALFPCHGSAKYEIKEQVCVNMKKNDDKLAPVSLSYSDYVDFIKKSAYFVDKSLLIHNLLQSRPKTSSVKIITAPNKWGKTLNLKMIEYFAQIELDKKGKQIATDQTSAYQYFTKGIILGSESLLENPPLLSNYTSFINGHLAKYPVIYIDFTKLQPKQVSYDSVYESFCQIISNTFSIHAYAKKVLEDKEAEKFTKIINGKHANFDEMTTGIHFLAQTLNKYFKKLPLILQDGFDQLILLAHFDKDRKFSITDREKMRQLFATFMLNTYDDYNNQYLGILTGVLNLEKAFFLGMKKVMEYNVFNDRIIYPYYGFTKTEISSLLEKPGFQDDMDKVDRFYSGYKFDGKPDKIYNPWPIVNYMHTKKFNDFVPINTESKYIIENLCKQKQFRDVAESLIRREAIDFGKHHTKILLRQCESVVKLIEDESCELTLSTNNLMTFLYNFGYLTMYNESTSYRYTLVNREASHNLASLVLNYYSNLFDSSTFSFIANECAQNLNDFIYSEESSSPQLKQTVRNIFEGIGNFQSNTVQDLLADSEFEDDIEGFIQCIMFIPILELHVQYDYDIKTKHFFIIATITGNEHDHGSTALVIKPVFDDEENVNWENKNDDFDFKTYFQDEPTIHIIKYVEVRVRKDGQVKVLCTMKTNEEKV